MAQDAPSSRPAEYTVVARRYRPRQFADLVGQEAVAQALTNALKGDRVAHAYLFTGARGVGKTSAARVLAKSLNCVTGPTPTPCDRCESCQGVAAGDDVDVIEIDAASNRGIDDSRAIRANVHTRPTRSRYKVYIIDEVHMLTKEAFNALLKTLEEPPAHVKFIFATTEVNKIPVTILSRCQRFDFLGIPAPRIADTLRGVVEAEGTQADPEALALVARRAGGSMRDAQSLLDQLLSFGGDKITVELVHRLLGTASDDRVLALAEAIVSKDVAGALARVGRFAEEGLQLGELLDQLIGHWRDLMLVACGGPEVAGLTAAGAQKAAVLGQAERVTLDTVLAGLDVWTTARGRMRLNTHAQVLLEMAVVRVARLEEILAVPQLVRMIADGTVPRSNGNAASPGDEAKKKMARPLTGDPA